MLTKRGEMLEVTRFFTLVLVLRVCTCIFPFESKEETSTTNNSGSTATPTGLCIIIHGKGKLGKRSEKKYCV